jgi:photosystem II stability/assembly factor-like uncharacterized protein
VPPVNAAQPTRWRITQPAGVERANPPGTPWVTIPIAAEPAGLRLIAGSAPSSLICWIVGESGLVLRSANSSTFVRVPFPEATDLTSVQAASALEATVTTRDGRMFRTSDGQNWIELP